MAKAKDCITFEVEWVKPSRANIVNHKGITADRARLRMTEIAVAAVDHALRTGDARVTIELHSSDVDAGEAYD